MGSHSKTLEHCIDCGTSFITNRSKRCDTCATLYRSECTKKQWKDPNFRQLVSDSSKLVMEKLWKDTNFRQLMSDNTTTQMLKQWSVDRNNMMSKRDEHCHIAKREATKKQWENADYRQFMSENTRLQVIEQWNDPNSNLRKSLYTRGIAFKPSSIEIKFKEYLDAAEINYIQQFRPKGYHRFYDFLLPNWNTLIEIDGMHWHYSEWAIKRGQQEIDTEKDEWAITHGYDIVRIPENVLTSTIVTDWLLPNLIY